MDLLLNFLDYIQANIDNNYIFTLLVFTIFMLLYNSLSIPGGIIFIAATGYFFGTFIGFFISIFSLVLGSFIFFTFSHYFIKKLFSKIIDKYIFNLQKYISNSSIEYLVIFRMIPGPPLFIQNILLSFLKITNIKFFISSFIGFAPIVFVAVFIGNQLKDINNIKYLSMGDIFTWKFFIFIFMLIFFLIIRIFYKRK